MANEFKVKNGLIIESITSASQANVLTYNSSTGLVYYTASSAIGGGTGPSTPAFPFNGNAVITGSLIITGSGLTIISGNIVTPSITSSLQGTASWAQNVVSASYITSSGVFGPYGYNSILSSSYALTASYALNAASSVGTAVTQSFTNSSTWIFTHNLGRREVAIQAYDTNYQQIIPSNITLDSSTQATLTFSTLASGFALATYGGSAANITIAGSTYATNIGDGLATDIGVTHNLNSRDIIIQLYDNTTYETVVCDITRPNVNFISCSFTVAPTTNQYRVVIKS